MNFELYTEVMPDEEGQNYAVYGGNLFLFNFKSGSFQPLQEHYEQVTLKVVPFCYRAIKKFGVSPNDKWLLTVMGQASATGNSTTNYGLARNRALMVAEFAVAEFNTYWQDQEGTNPPSLVPNYQIVGDKLSRMDSIYTSGATSSRVEEKQGQYRSAIFLFKAATPAPPPLVKGQIRKVFGAEFKVESKPISKVFEVGGAFYKVYETLKKFTGTADVFPQISKVSKELGPMLTVATHMVKFMIPSDVVLGYQLTGKTQPDLVYRFDGTEHTDSWGFMELLGMVCSIDSITDAVKILKTAKTGMDALKFADALVTMAQVKESIISWFINRARSMFGEQAARSLTLVFANFDDFKKGTLVAGSDWAVFAFHKSAPVKSTAGMEGRAKRTVFGTFYFSTETVKFGGPVQNNWIDFNAEGDIRGGFDPVGGQIFQSTWSEGIMKNLGHRAVIE